MADNDDAMVLPPGLDLLWGRRMPGSRGPKPGLSVDAIVAAAIAIANAEGLDAVSMARVARAVGFTPMSLYRHVSNKDELLQLMWNASTDDLAAFEQVSGDWRAKLSHWAMTQRDVIEANIWIVQMPLATPPLGPNSVRWIEYGLEALDGTGLGDGDKMRILGLLSSHALISARMGFDARQSVPGTGDKPVDYTAVLRELVRADDYPQLHRVIWSGDVDDGEAGADLVDEFRFDVEIILDGIEARLDGADRTSR
jgi:AcrR family transcriptional regulator